MKHYVNIYADDTEIHADLHITGGSKGGPGLPGPPTPILQNVFISLILFIDTVLLYPTQDTRVIVEQM